MANFNVIKQCVMICREANIPLFIWGHRGIGKSSLIRDICNDNGFGLCDYRMSQIESSDIRGLPYRTEDCRTSYASPDDLPIGDMDYNTISSELEKFQGHEREEKLHNLQKRFKNGILFLDELFRAQDDVLQAIFQLVLDRKIGSYVLPRGWSIVAASNFINGYIVNGFTDPALIDRFCHVTLNGGDSTFQEWVDYMYRVHGNDSSRIIEFTSQNMKNLDGDISGDLGFNIQPSRRSWDSVSRVLKITSDKYDDAAKFEVLSGLIGRELTISFLKYSCPIKPLMIIEHGVAANASAMEKLSRNQMIGLMWGLSSMAKNRLNEQNISNVCLDFAEYVATNVKEKDVAVAFCRSLIQSGSKLRTSALSNSKVANMVNKIDKKMKLSSNEASFIDALNSRPSLQKILRNVSWGSDD